MGDAGVLTGFVLVALTALAAFVTLLAGLTWPAVRRSGLVAVGLPLALLPPVVAAGYASWRFIRLFSGLMQAPGATQDLPAAFAQLWLLQRVAWGAFAGACLVGLVLGLSSLFASPGDDGPRCSARRGVVLLLLPALALLVAGSAARPFVKTLRVSSALVSSEGKDPAVQKRAEVVFEAEGLARKGPGSIARTSRFISRGLVLGVLGGVLGVLVLLGLAVPGVLLAWRVGFGAAFTVAASATWLVAAAVASLVALGIVDPLLQP